MISISLGNPQGVFKAFSKFQKSLHVIHTEKCGILWPKPTDPPEIVSEFADRMGLTVHRGTMVSLGTLLGTGESQLRMARETNRFSQALLGDDCQLKWQCSY